MIDNWFENPIVQGVISAVVAGAILSIAGFWIKKLRKNNEYGFTLEKFLENEKEYVRLLHPKKTIESCTILCNKDPCGWWDNNSVLPRHIREGEGGNVLLPRNAEEINPMIIVMSGKRAIRKIKLKDIILTHP